ncbi:MAG: hypothetical protein WCC17_05665, partial [Candidatus Nitrosopolaris sp.]
LIQNQTCKTKDNHSLMVSHSKPVFSYMQLPLFKVVLPLSMTSYRQSIAFNASFSKTPYFDFNPDPLLAAVLTMIGYPLSYPRPT